MPLQACTSHWPSPFHPVATTVPSALSPTVWDFPVLAAVCTFPAATAPIVLQAETSGSA
jgi:hypothetical protein